MIVNPNNYSKRIVLPSEYKTRDGEVIKEVVLKAREGDIFLKKNKNIIIKNRI